MNYFERIESCTTLDDLFAVWKAKAAVQHRYVSRGKTSFIETDFAQNGFISDGIINNNVWNGGQYPKILFVMKNLKTDEESVDIDIRPEMRKGNESSLWTKRGWDGLYTIAKWAIGICLTDKERIEPFFWKAPNTDWWNNIAIMLIKKENGNNDIINPDIIDLYADSDNVELKREIEIIDPDIVVCCSTYRTLMTFVYGFDPESTSNPIYSSETMENNWCNLIPINGRDRLFINYVEPGWPELVAYYGLVNIYQQALIKDLIKR